MYATLAISTLLLLSSGAAEGEVTAVASAPALDENAPGFIGPQRPGLAAQAPPAADELRFADWQEFDALDLVLETAPDFIGPPLAVVEFPPILTRSVDALGPKPNRWSLETPLRARESEMFLEESCNSSYRTPYDNIETLDWLDGGSTDFARAAWKHPGSNVVIYFRTDGYRPWGCAP